MIIHLIIFLIIYETSIMLLRKYKRRSTFKKAQKRANAGETVLVSRFA